MTGLGTKNGEENPERDGVKHNVVSYPRGLHSQRTRAGTTQDTSTKLESL